MKSHRISLIAHGTRGDVEPMIALGLELQRRGHKVRLGAPEAFCGFVTKYGLEAYPLRCGMDRMLATRFLWRYTRGGLLGRWAYIHDIQMGLGAKAFDDVHDACRDAEAIIFHPLMPFASHVGEGLGVPTIVATFQPMMPTGEFAMFSLTGIDLGQRFNRLSYAIGRWPYAYFARRMNLARKRLFKLRRRGTFADPFAFGGKALPAIHAIGTAVVPRPKDWSEEWDVTGYWFLDAAEDYVPSAGLTAFLEAAEKPVYVGFGSNPFRSPQKLASMLAAALRATGKRAILCLNSEQQAAEIKADSSLVHVAGPIPHRWIFRHVSAAIHHGGAGTVAASLRAGLPTLVCPLLIDQGWWGSRVFTLGAGPKPLRFNSISQTSLTDRLRDLTANPSYGEKARDIAAAIAADGGTSRAADFIESRLQARHDLGNSPSKTLQSTGKNYSE